MKAALLDYIRARTPAIFVQSPEADRVCADITDLLTSKSATKPALIKIGLDGKGTYAVTPTSKSSISEGVEKKRINYLNPDDLVEMNDPYEAITKIMEAENTIFVFEDFHMFFDDTTPMLVGLLKKLFPMFKNQGSIFIICGCRSNIPPELEKEFIFIEYEFPDRDRLKYLVQRVVNKTAKLCNITDEAIWNIAGALSGLTIKEAENILYLSMVKNNNTFPVDFIANEKATILKKSGTLEIIEATSGIDDIGGLDILKDWLMQRRTAFGPSAKEFGLPAPKGILMLGLPGTGKSLTAKATANILQRPLLRLDAGSVFGSLVGQSEENLRTALKIAESIAPCVLWIDEIEKAFSGTKSSNSSDGGTTSRVFGIMLNWMQEKKAPVFVIGTANDVKALPEEFLRKGRFDDVWFTDLPNDEERQVIWNIQIRKYGRDPSAYDTETLAELSPGFTGAEIEQTFIEAMYSAFHVNSEVKACHIMSAVNSCVPLSKMKREDINRTREWAKTRCRMASVA